jgi:3-isopropylmalate/(R)-2-methylmalate dehydratase small subunit
MQFIGKARRLPQNDDINTDYIISGRYKFKIQDPNELATHVMEDLDPKFFSRVEKGDFIVVGNNFGCGSSREQAPMAIKYAGISAILAKSFARIFYRNSFNLGLPALEIETDDELVLDLDLGTLTNKTSGKIQKFPPLPKTMQTLLADGGLVSHFKKHGGFGL